uniref:Uncharacterized protein n=1 Tax=Timema genevievae TaxID=629358 RepID=A0A7R9PRI4_TIMGE|nr:unnamed protein product [Timema genevievae]
MATGSLVYSESRVLDHAATGSLVYSESRVLDHMATGSLVYSESSWLHHTATGSLVYSESSSESSSLDHAATGSLVYSESSSLDHTVTGSLVYSESRVLDHTATGSLVYSESSLLDHTATGSLVYSESSLLDHTATEAVQDCNDLVLNKDSFKYARQLQVLSIKRTRNVTLAMGVFSSLNSLNIEDVYYLRFQPGSFMGASGVATISIRRSFISELPIFALYNMTGLRIFELDNVNLGNVKSQSLHLQMDNYQSRFTMTNCTIAQLAIRCRWVDEQERGPSVHVYVLSSQHVPDRSCEIGQQFAESNNVL